MKVGDADGEDDERAHVEPEKCVRLPGGWPPLHAILTDNLVSTFVPAWKRGIEASESRHSKWAKGQSNVSPKAVPPIRHIRSRKRAESHKSGTRHINRQKKAKSKEDDGTDQSEDELDLLDAEFTDAEYETQREKGWVVTIDRPSLVNRPMKPVYAKPDAFGKGVGLEVLLLSCNTQG